MTVRATISPESNPAWTAGFFFYLQPCCLPLKDLWNPRNTVHCHDCVGVSYSQILYVDDISKSNLTQSWNPRVSPTAMIVSNSFHKYIYYKTISQKNDCHDCVKIILVSKLIVGLTQSHNHGCHCCVEVFIKKRLTSTQSQKHGCEGDTGISWLCRSLPRRWSPTQKRSLESLTANRLTPMVGSRGASMLKIITSDKNSYPTRNWFWGVKWGWIHFGTGRGEGEEVKG